MKKSNFGLVKLLAFVLAFADFARSQQFASCPREYGCKCKDLSVTCSRAGLNYVPAISSLTEV